jgi:hypothetical protein
MPCNLDDRTERCAVCDSLSNQRSSGLYIIVDCKRCGDFQISRDAIDDIGLPYNTPKEQAPASYIIRKMQAPRTRPILTRAFFGSLNNQSLPSPAEASDNLITWLAEQADGMPGATIKISYDDPALQAIVGVVDPAAIGWIAHNLKSKGLLILGSQQGQTTLGTLTIDGWQKFEELKRAHISSRYAFFARRFNNFELDKAFEECLRPAVEATGSELRIATQRAGLVDAVIEDEIRRCRFLVADLSDDNAGAYWEAGFAEGLGKPVIYVCCAKKDGVLKETHFDANHRNTVRWDLDSLDETGTQLKAVIRNTLLGDAKQTD